MIDRTRSSFSQALNAVSLKPKPCGFAREVKAVSSIISQPRMSRSKSVPEAVDIRYAGKPLFWFRAKALQKGGCSSRGICQVAAAQEETFSGDVDSDYTIEDRIHPLELLRNWENRQPCKNFNKEVAESSAIKIFEFSIDCSDRFSATRGSQCSMLSSGDESLLGLAFLEEETNQNEYAA